MSASPRISAVLIGADSLLVQCGELLLSEGHELRAVLTAEPRIRAWADARGIAVVEPTGDYAPSVSALPAFDWLFSITHLAVVPPAVLAVPRKGSVNFHDGPLPLYGGLNAPTWAILDGRAEHGITWHLMSDRADRGDILDQVRFPVAADDTSLTLNLRCWEAGIASFAGVVRALADGSASPRPHALDEATYHRRHDRPAACGLLRWSEPAVALERLVRALDFGTAYPNPMAAAHFPIDGDLVVVTAAQAIEMPAGEPAAAAGTVLEVGDDRLVIACGTGALALTGFSDVDGAPLSAPQVAARAGRRVGSLLPEPDAAHVARRTRRAAELASHERFWAARLRDVAPPEIPLAATPARGGAVRRIRSMPLPADVVAAWDARGEPGGMGDFLLTAFAAFVARLCAADRITLAFRDTALAKTLEGDERWFATFVPLEATAHPDDTFFAAFARMKEELEAVRHRRGHVRTLVAREPALRGARRELTIAFEQAEHVADHHEEAAQHLTLLAAADRATIEWHYRPDVLDDARIGALQSQFAAFLGAIAREWRTPVAELPLVDDSMRHRLLEEWNDAELVVAADVCVHDLVAAQMARTPDATALVCRDHTLTYGELDARVTRVARELRRLGVGPDVLVALCAERSLDMVIGLLAIHRAGGAYVPLDPDYPAERLALMLEDSQAPVLLTQRSLLESLPPTTAAVLCVDAVLEGADDGAPLVPGGARPEHLAYVIYTSGSTGTPKGVMVEHRNVVNFFAGMDERLGTEPGVWLAVTSLSFDISVLELLWTLTRGYTVVIQTETPRSLAAPGARGAAAAPVAGRGMEFSLFYFSADAAADDGRDKYRVLLEGARFADEHGFVAVWTPERHFHAFGGLYPNPSVTGAAVAAVTKRVGVRAGSCVLPLHHPLRVAEEWSVVDNISNGRVGIAFASGWQPNDFVLRPESFGRAKEVLVEHLDVVRRLWRGESLTLDGPNGKPLTLGVLPRPVQAELPVWLTTAGNPESYALAGRLGARVLTHLLGQSVEELAQKLAIYREAWREAGHAGEGHVTLMLHTFVGDDDAAVKSAVREPLREYLRTSIGLVKQYASSFPALKRRPDGSLPEIDFDALSADEMDALLEYSFERYYETSGLFGTPATCARMVHALTAIGVDEIACLVDFGLDADTILSHLPHLDRVRAAHAGARAPEAGDWSVAANLVRHGVTHLQCTPSMASMLTADEPTRGALRSLRALLIGGEAFPAELADALRALTGATIHNMYGPTETTIWSATHRVRPGERPIPLGTPIANTRLYVVDAALRLLPPDTPGELLIGGAGVVRGYLGRPELTAERFVSDPFRSGERAYRTGDLVRRRPDGALEFLGRLDHQVKIRGYRIELGEIEAVLRRELAVRDAVVVAREDVPGDKRLVAFVTATPGARLDGAALRERCRTRLPIHLVPSHVIVLDELPQTPNRKVDRNALVRRPLAAAASAEARALPPSTELERSIAEIWRDALRVATVGVEDNFFDLGGHSLIAVQVHARLRRTTGRELAITDLFRFPTVRTLARHLARQDGETAEPAGATAARDRGDARRQLLMQRRQPRRSDA